MMNLKNIGEGEFSAIILCWVPKLFVNNCTKWTFICLEMGNGVVVFSIAISIHYDLNDNLIMYIVIENRCS